MRTEAINQLEHLLIKCIAGCETCATKSINSEEAAAMSDSINLNRDCADICSLASKLLARKSKYLEEVLQLCIESCTNCKEECSKHSTEHCQHCAKICTECAEACQDYLNKIG
jgi:hypothetical protein